MQEQHDFALRILDSHIIAAQLLALGSVCDGGHLVRWYNVQHDKDATLEDNWFTTGDVATIDRYGHFQITDRSKDVIKSGGEWVSSIEVEGVIMSHPAVHPHLRHFRVPPAACLASVDGPVATGFSLESIFGMQRNGALLGYLRMLLLRHQFCCVTAELLCRS